MAEGRRLYRGKQLGEVRKSFPQGKWSARFQFERQGARSTFDGPVRARRYDAEIDRKFVAAAMG